jgi:NitT/TauT family transport system substrate-binding protein
MNLKKPPAKGGSKERFWEDDMVRLVAALATVLIGTMLAALPARAADKVVLMLNWYVYGEHAPFYYGKAKVLYAAEGIDL